MVTHWDLIPSSPPTQALLDKLCVWRLHVLMLGMVFFLSVVCMDFGGAMLVGVMLVLATFMLSDGMQDMGKYAVLYAALAGLNLLSGLVVVFTQVFGRVSRQNTPIKQEAIDGATRSTTYTLTTQFTPFFDMRLGLMYNVESFTTVLMPVTMLLGLYLGLHANLQLSDYTDSDSYDIFGAPPEDTESIALNSVAGSNAFHATHNSCQGLTNNGAFSGPAFKLG